jgi:hypothetical protein
MVSSLSQADFGFVSTDAPITVDILSIHHCSDCFS